METVQEKPRSSSTDAPDRLFTLKCKATIRKDVRGRERLYKNIPVTFEAKRDTPPVDPESAFAGDVPDRGKKKLSVFFTKEEAEAVSNALSEDPQLNRFERCPQSLPLSLPEEASRWALPRYLDGAGSDELVLSYEIDGLTVMGWGFYRKAEWKEWTEETKTITIEVPEGMADRITSDNDPAGYIARVERKAEMWSESSPF